MKPLLYLFLVLASSNLNAQEAELENFKTELSSFIDFNLNKNKSMPINKTNYDKLEKKVEQAFDAFVKNSASQDAVNFKTDHKNVKFRNLDSRISVQITTFATKKSSYAVYRYSSFDKNAYVIKDVNSNLIVYHGKSTPHSGADVDKIYEIDDKHILLIESNGDLLTSKTAMILSNAQPKWKLIKGFGGKALEHQSSDKASDNERYFLNLYCNFETTLVAPKEANKIYFDGTTKTISYKVFENEKASKLVSAKWENNKFIIDDYNLNKDFSAVAPNRPY